LDAVTSALKGKLPAGLCLSIIGTEGRFTHGVIDTLFTGIGCEEFVEKKWSAPGFTPIRWSDADGVAHRSLFISSWGDGEDALKSAVAAIGRDAEYIVSLEVGEPNSPVATLVERDADAVSETFLTDQDSFDLDIAWSDFLAQNPEANDNYAVERLKFERQWMDGRAS
jgi:hypothetical protein